MEAIQTTLSLETDGRGTHDITADVERTIEESGLKTGLCHVFSRHTSAGVIITENADPTVREDLERLLAELAPDGWHKFRHTAEGEDDMSAHARNLLTGDSVLVPVREGRLALGTWQGIYLWEHRCAPHRREIVITLLG
jgi:secondary thiamine-phosphate synthase enzyme